MQFSLDVSVFPNGRPFAFATSLCVPLGGSGLGTRGEDHYRFTGHETFVGVERSSDVPQCFRRLRPLLLLPGAAIFENVSCRD